MERERAIQAAIELAALCIRALEFESGGGIPEQRLAQFRFSTISMPISARCVLHSSFAIRANSLNEREPLRSMYRSSPASLKRMAQEVPNTIAHKRKWPQLLIINRISIFVNNQADKALSLAG